MPSYIVSKRAQPNGDHEVHVTTCSSLPWPENRHFLGEFPSCFEAVAAAKRIYLKTNGCAQCCNECHT